jgi:hypothetical protein
VLEPSVCQPVLLYHRLNPDIEGKVLVLQKNRVHHTTKIQNTTSTAFKSVAWSHSQEVLRDRKEGMRKNQNDGTVRHTWFLRDR